VLFLIKLYSCLLFKLLAFCPVLRGKPQIAIIMPQALLALLDFV